MRVLVLAPRHPIPTTRGDQRRVLEVVRHLREHADVALLSFGDDAPLPFPGVRVGTVRPRPLGRARANLSAPHPLLPLQVRLYLDAGMRRAVAEELRSFRPDVVHVTLARLGPYLPPPNGAHRHLDLVDSLALNMRTRASASTPALRAVLKAEAALMERYEAGLTARADSASLVSDADRAAARGLERAQVIPNGVDLDAFPFRDPRPRPPVLLFFGNLGYFHAVEPAKFVAQEVMPRVRARVPAARLRIAGARPGAAVRRLDALDGVEVVGPVPDMADELHGAAAAVLPMFTGSGMKNKVLEAFCTGTPVVANAEGVLGVEGAQPGRHFVGGEGADALAEACVELLTTPERRLPLAQAGRALVEERFTWDARVRDLVALYGATR